MSDSWLETIHGPLVDLIQKKSRLSLQRLIRRHPFEGCIVVDGDVGAHP